MGSTDSLRSVIEDIQLEKNPPQLALRPEEKGVQPAFLYAKDNFHYLKVQFQAINGICFNCMINAYVLQTDFTFLHSQTILHEGIFFLYIESI